MSEKDIERLGNRPVSSLKPPEWWAESKTKLSKAIRKAPRYGRGIAAGGRGLRGFTTAIRTRITDKRSSGHILLSVDLMPKDVMNKVEYKFVDKYLVVQRSKAQDAFMRQNRKHSNGFYFHLPRKLIIENKIQSGVYEAVFDNEIDGVVINLEKKVAS